MELQGIDLILGERLDMSSIDEQTRSGKAVNSQGRRIVRTEKGREIAADLLVREYPECIEATTLIFAQLLCTGQAPNTAILAAMDPATINPANKQAYVQRTMQLTTAPAEAQLASAVDASLSLKESSRPKAVPNTYSNIFVVGDAADAFGAIAAGHNAYYQVTHFPSFRLDTNFILG